MSLDIVIKSPFVKNAVVEAMDANQLPMVEAIALTYMQDATEREDHSEMAPDGNEYDALTELGRGIAETTMDNLDLSVFSVKELKLSVDGSHMTVDIKDSDDE